jgi:exodeoxyribonuclease VII large subunit
LRAPTPSAAAELTTPDLSDLIPWLDDYLTDLRRRITAKLERKQQRLNSVMKLLDALSPEKIFTRGYAAVFDNSGNAIKNAKNIKIGEELNIKLAEGDLKVTVKEKM